MPIRALLAVLVLFATACQQTPIKRLPAFERAARIPPKAATKSVEAESLDASKLPSLVPYAIVSAQTDLGLVQVVNVMLQNLSKQAQPPDLFLVQGTGSTYTGSVYSGGLSGGFSIPIYKATLAAVAYRIAPCKAGVTWDESGMITAVADPARACGIQEGDRIVSFAGTPVSLGEQWAMSPHYVKIFELKPGEETELVWIRPGTGRMSGKVKLLPNTAIPDDLQTIESTHKPKAVTLD